MVIIIGNSYRKQLFYPFIRVKSFGHKNFHLYVNQDKLNSFLLRLFLWFALRFCRLLVISDKEGANILSNFSICSKTKVLWFCWNTWLELRDWDLPKYEINFDINFAFLFAEQARLAKSELSIKCIFLKSPVFPYEHSDSVKNQICYIGEVDISEKFKNSNQIDSKLWELAENIVHNDGEIEGNIELTRISSNHRGSINKEQIIWILKNRVRFLFAKEMKREYGKDFLLIGNDWIKLGLDNKPTNYDFKYRLKIYSESKVCLDFQSKSTIQSHYPRSAEILSVSNGLVQLKTQDSHEFLKNQTELRTFTNIKTLFQRVNNFFDMPLGEFNHLGQQLRMEYLTENHKFLEVNL